MDYTSLVHQAEQGQPPPIALVHGADTQLLDDVLAAVTRGLFREPSEAVFDREVVDGREVGVDSLVQAALTLPVLTPRRLVAVRHAQALKVSGAPAIAQYAAAPNPSTCLLLLADESLTASRDRKDHWLLEAVPRSFVVAPLMRDPRSLEAWLRQRAAQEGLTVSDEAARLLIQWVGDDGAALLGEVRKAALAGGPRNQTVGVAEVGAVVGEHRLAALFDLTRAIERRDIGAALRTVDALLVTEEPMLLLSIVSREVRTAWTIRESLRRGQSVDQIARALRRPVGAVQAYAAAATGASAAAWAAKSRRCWDVERRLKSGGEPRGELTALVAELCGASSGR